MRLAQIARKVQIKPAEVRSFIKEKFGVELDSDPNIKLDDDQVNAVLEHFKVEDTEEVKQVEKEKEATVDEIPIDPTVDTDIETLKEVAEEEAGDTTVEIPDVTSEDTSSSDTDDSDKAESDSEPESKERKVVPIQTAEGEDEDQEAKSEDPESFEEVEVDPDAEIITAQVDKLEGVKVIGKIDLLGDPPPEEELPTSDAIEDEIDALDGEVDTSEFPDLTEENTDEEKEAIFAELDAQMEQKTGKDEVKKVTNEASEVKENMDEEEEEYSIYKDKQGRYRFTAEQKRNREVSLAQKAERDRIEALKKKKKRHYEKNVAAKVQKPPSKQKQNKNKSIKKAAEKSQKEEPKGLWQKFLNWLND
ncbi:MAG: hypothetical protein HUJ25_12690 [Crocinitomicaceae bacterium]|nr:hypothetical protein [Crocinitomicaceae bacterium]